MRQTQTKGSAHAVKERGGALVLALSALLLTASGVLAACGEKTVYQPGPPTPSGCAAGLNSCDGACVDTQSNGAHCGSCGNVCSAGLVCSLGACSTGCAAGLNQCGNSCANFASDPAHCGACNNACAAGTQCSNGACITTGSGGAPGTGGVPGAGGASGGSSGGPGSGGSAGGGDCTPGTGVEGGGYILNGTWHGYGFTAAADSAATPPTTPSSITPADFGDKLSFPLCAQGTVGDTYDSVAMIGWNLNEEINDECGEMNPINTVTPTLDGIYIEISNPGNSPLRLQIQGPNGATDPNDRWCAPISASGFVAYETFNTECWSGGMGVAYARQPITSALVLVPGDITGPTQFDFCVNSIIESVNNADPPGQGCSLSNGPGSGTGALSNSQTLSVNRDGRNYIVQNNVWNGNAGAQTVTVNAGVDFTVSAQGNNQPTTGAPASFPSVFIGSNHGRASMNSGLPKQVSSLVDVPTGWRWSGANGEMNAAYDVWFSTGPGGDAGNPSGGYLMVWFHDPPAAQPLGSPQGSATLAGRNWNIWQCPGACQNGVPVVSYVPASGSIPEMSFDLNDFIQHATTPAAGSLISPSWYLTNIFAGFEIWSGGQGARTHDFCAIVQ